MFATFRTAFRTNALKRSTYQPRSFMSTQNSDKKEQMMQELLRTELQAEDVKVVDISGGCGSMYQIEVVSQMFEGKSRVNQHRMVNSILKKEIGEMHGLTVKTKRPSDKM